MVRMLATILWLGNVHFVENAQGDAEIANPDVTAFCAYLLEVDPSAVQRALTQRIMETQRGGRRGSVYEVPLNPTQAAAVRDALSKAIYNNLFDWIGRPDQQIVAGTESDGGLCDWSVGHLRL